MSMLRSTREACGLGPGFRRENWGKPLRWFFGSTSYCCMEEIRRSPVEVGSLSHYLQRFLHPSWLLAYFFPQQYLALRNVHWKSLQVCKQMQRMRTGPSGEGAAKPRVSLGLVVDHKTLLPVLVDRSLGHLVLECETTDFRIILQDSLLANVDYHTPVFIPNLEEEAPII